MGESNLDIIVSLIDNFTNGLQGIDNEISNAESNISNSFDESTQSTEENTSAIEENSQAQTENSSTASENASSQKEVSDAKKEDASSSEEASMATELLTVAMEGLMTLGVADTLWQCAEAAGGYEDSVNRVGLAMEGIGVSSSEANKMVSSLSETTGRSAGSIRESMIQMSSYGITSSKVMEQVFTTASGQAYILGSSVDQVANKYASLAMKSSIAERTLKGTGITVAELGQALGMQGASIDEISSKWETMTIDQRAALLAQAGAMNEGAKATQEFKNSWEGVNESLNKAFGYLKVLAGEVLLPVLVPAMQALSWVLGKVSSGFKALMDSELGPIITILASVGSSVILAALAFQTIMGIIPLVSGALTGLSGALIGVEVAGLPLWAVIAAVTALAIAIFEIGKSFGWWTDISSMFEAISAGLNRLWAAFSNNEDVRTVVNAFKELYTILEPVGQAFMDLIGVNQQASGEFDIVRAIIDTLGGVFHTLVSALTSVYDGFMFIVGCVQNTISFFEGLWNIINSGPQKVSEMVTGIITFIATLPVMIPVYLAQVEFQILDAILKWVTGGKVGAKKFINGILNTIKSLPSKVWTYLKQVASKIISAGSNWLSNAKSAALKMVTGVTSGLSGLASAVFGKFKGVTDAINNAATGAITAAKNFGARALQAFKNAVNSNSPSDFFKIPEHDFNAIAPMIKKAQPGAVNAVKGFGKSMMSAYDVGFGDDLNLNNNFEAVSTGDKGTYTFEFVHDLKNVPSGVNERALAEMINKSTSSDKFVKALASNPVFQQYDLRMKNRLSRRVSRLGGA